MRGSLAADALEFDWRGARTHVLAYTHFSVVMSRSRRMPIVSACNIDGATLRSLPRDNAWKLDPRIPQACQLLRRVYGNARDGYFSRGHMTRRQDPDWGDAEVAARADADTFHVTNAAPQVQGFNAGLWGAIEDYVLANVRADKMRICVMTGPVFGQSDPVVHGVRIPVQFWKVVAFTREDTAEMVATGYVASQAAALAGLHPAFVFGEFAHQQRPLAAIEALTCLDFGSLRERDVLFGAGPTFAAALRDTRDIMLA
jgi:endonuclease G